MYALRLSSLSLPNSFFAQVKLRHEQLNVSEAEQVANLYKTGSTPGKVLGGAYKHCVVILAGSPVVLSNANFVYLHRVTILAAVVADGSNVLSVVVFKGEYEPRISSERSLKRFKEVVQNVLCVFWRKGVASLDISIFSRWIEMFVPQVRNNMRADQ